MLVVTGANGFLGSYLVCELLRNGHGVKALKRQNSGLEEFEYISEIELGDKKSELLAHLIWDDADIEDILSLDKAFAGAEIVFHCAAMIGFNGERKRLMQVNAEGTANVVNACLSAGVRKLAYASSTAALGRTDSGALISEETQWVDDDNNTVYAESKHLAELEVWRGVEEGLDAVIINPGIILGAGKWDKGSCRIFNTVYRGLKFYTNGVNGYVGASDCASILSRLAFSEIRNQRFILVAENLSYLELLTKISKAFGIRIPPIEIKPSYKPWISWIFKLNGWFNPRSSLSAETLRTSLKKHIYDNGKIKKEGFVFQPVSEVIARSCAAYQSTLSEK